MRKRGYYSRGFTLSVEEKEQYFSSPEPELEIECENVLCSTPFDKLLKIYNDGNHYVATEVRPRGFKRGDVYNVNPFGYLNDVFDLLYEKCVKQGMKSKQIFDYIKTEIIDTYLLADNTPEFDKYIICRIKQKLNNFYKKLKRFRRKAYLNKWNYFVTITFDSKKHSATTFRTKLKKTLANFHTRRGWRYMGVFEKSPENNLVHFHGLFYVPAGEMVGSLVKIRDYSTKQHKMQESVSNSFFADKFGRNDFAKLENVGKAIDYILKYLRKDNENIFYSRGIFGEVCKIINDEDIATTFEDFVLKYVLFDDVIDWERDILPSSA